MGASNGSLRRPSVKSVHVNHRIAANLQHNSSLRYGIPVKTLPVCRDRSAGPTKRRAAYLDNCLCPAVAPNTERNQSAIDRYFLKPLIVGTPTIDCPL